MSGMDQEEIDKLLAEALGGTSDDTPPADSAGDAPDAGAQTQEDIDALISGIGDEGDEGPASQGDIDALLADMGGEGEAAADAPPADAAASDAEEADVGADQGDIDALLAGMAGEEEAPAEEGPATQNDIDELLAGMADGEAAAAAATEAKAEAEADASEASEDSGPANQDDIDALLSGMSGGEDEADADAVAEDAGGPADQSEIDELMAAMGGTEGEDTVDGGDASSQDDIDALMAAMGGEGESPDDDAASADAAGADAADDGDSGSQEDIDALMSAMEGGGEDTEIDDGGAEGEEGSQEEIDALMSAMGGAASGDADADAGEADAAADDDEAGEGGDVEALLAGLGDRGASDTDEADAESEEDGDGSSQDDIDALLAGMETESEEAEEESASISGEEEDIDALLAGLESEDEGEDEGASEDEGEAGEALETEAAALADLDEPTPADTPSQSGVDRMLDGLGGTAEVPPSSAELDQMMGGAATATPATAPMEPVAAPRHAPAAPVQAPEHAHAAQYAQASQVAAQIPQNLPPDRIKAIEESLSLMCSSTDVEKISGDIASLLGQLAERAKRFQTAFVASDQEAKHLRSLVAARDHTLTVLETDRDQRVASLEGEKNAYRQEVEELRKTVNRVTGERLAAEEAARTEVASLQVQLREQSSRAQMLSAEVQSLKEELERARTDSTGSDLESRRFRFEAERLKNELASERQERLRMQRALENREKELQAMQAQAAGHASTLFLDELHRLVRRLESELDVRTSAAHDALGQLQRLKREGAKEEVLRGLHAAVSQAAGLTRDEDDALDALAHDAERPKPQEAPPAPPPGPDTLLKALERHDFAEAAEMAGAILRAGQRTPVELMEEVYRCQALRRSEVSEKLGGLLRLLRGIKDVQEAADRARGRESAETDRLFVEMFDFLHTLVRLKILGRGDQEAWRFFLDLRGRFNFLTSDKQWQAYRDKVLAH